MVFLRPDNRVRGFRVRRLRFAIVSRIDILMTHRLSFAAVVELVHAESVVPSVPVCVSGV